MADPLDDRDAARLAARDLQLLERLDRKPPLDELVRGAQARDPAADDDHFLRHYGLLRLANRRGRELVQVVFDEIPRKVDLAETDALKAIEPTGSRRRRDVARSETNRGALRSPSGRQPPVAVATESTTPPYSPTTIPPSTGLMSARISEIPMPSGRTRIQSPPRCKISPETPGPCTKPPPRSMKVKRRPSGVSPTGYSSRSMGAVTRNKNFGANGNRAGCEGTTCEASVAKRSVAVAAGAPSCLNCVSATPPRRGSASRPEQDRTGTNDTSASSGCGGRSTANCSSPSDRAANCVRYPRATARRAAVHPIDNIHHIGRMDGTRRDENVPRVRGQILRVPTQRKPFLGVFGHNEVGPNSV